MQFFYWNINRSITDEKKKWLERITTSELPDILCIAEGPDSIVDCHETVLLITSKGYHTYYSPTFYSENVISNQYEWNRFGLKIFIKSSVRLKSRFAFGNQKLEGRIIYLRFELAGRNYSTFLIHGMSKAGDEISQHDFIIELSNFIRAKTINKENDGILILGDFNLEPWDDLLKNKKYLYSLFYDKLYKYHSTISSIRVYYNPILDFLQNHSDPNLIGTFYNKKHISVLDYPLVSKDVVKFKFNVLTEIENTPLMQNNNGKFLLVNNLDHLPITLKIF